MVLGNFSLTSRLALRPKMTLSIKNMSIITIEVSEMIGDTVGYRVVIIKRIKRMSANGMTMVLRYRPESTKSRTKARSGPLSRSNR